MAEQTSFGSAESPQDSKIEELEGEGDLATSNLRERARRSDVSASNLQEKSAQEEGEVQVL